MDHAVEAVRIERDVVAVVCACGWESSGCCSETEARDEWAQHTDGDA